MGALRKMQTRGKLGMRQRQQEMRNWASSTNWEECGHFTDVNQGQKGQAERGCKEGSGTHLPDCKSM